MRSSNRSQVDPFIVMDVMEAARLAEDAGRHVIHMEVGQPGTAAPKPARDAVEQIMAFDTMGYTVALGLPKLKQDIAALYDRWYGVDLNPDRVVVTSGSSAGFLLSFTALFDAGDRVGIGAPGYPSYRQILKSLSLTPVDIPAKLENGFQPTANDIAAHDVEGMLIASPANPTGTMLSKSELAAVIDATQAKGAAFISDEIYHGIEYDQPAVTALSISDDVYVINSFSKYFSMTGWRLGWMVVPEDHVRTIERLAQNMFICSPHVSQVAGIGALTADAETKANLDVYTANRALMIDALPKMGLMKFAPPDGAFYVYVDISQFGMNSLDMAKDILDKVDVAVTPGVDFDPERGGDYLRFSYARSTQDIREGLDRLAKYFGNLS